MRHSSFIKSSFIAFLLLMLLACGGGASSGGGGTVPTATPAPNIHLAQSTVNFAGVVVDNSADRALEIRNTGDMNLKIEQISQPDSPYSIISDTCSNVTLTPSQSCSLGIRFSPTIQGSSTAILSIHSNDPNASAESIQLSGDGYGLNVWINNVDTASCPSISADVTVTDPRNYSLLNSLTRDNFRLYQNGQLQNINVTAIQYPSPVSLVLTLDWSGSTVNVISFIQAAANNFINQLSNGDWAAICKFSTAIEFFPLTSPPFIAGDNQGKAALNAYINTPFTVGETAFHDAVFQSIDRAAQGTTDKRAVIVLSDGEDTYSVKTLDQVIAYAIQQGIPVFTIFYVDPNYVGFDYQRYTQIMQRLAVETGGQYYNSDTGNLTDVFRQISNVLSNKYTLTYISPTCPGTISLDVRADWSGSYGQDSRSISP